MAASSSIQESGSFDYRSFWMLAVAVITPINSIAARSLLITLTPIQLIVIRSSSIAACILLWAIFRRRPLATPCAGHQILRAFFGVLAMCCWFWSLNRQPLANATALFYTSPIFLALGALWGSLKRKQDLPWGSLGSILLGFIGIVLILSPCIHNFNQQNLLPMLVSLFGGFCASQAILKIRHMRKWKEPAWRTAMYFSAISAFGAAFLIDFDDLFSVLRANDASLPYAMLILVLVCLALMKQLFFTMAFMAKHMLLSAVFEYFTIAISALFGLLFYEEHLSPSETTGIFAIMLAGIGASYRTKTVSTN